MDSKPNQIPYPFPPDEYQYFTSDDKNPIDPPRPPDGPIVVFGEKQNDEDMASLEDQGVMIMYNPENPPLLELKKINHKILFAFQKLVGVIAEGGDNPNESLEEIKNLFMNAHYLLHKLRTAQAYEHMHHCLREQMKQLEEFKKKYSENLDEIAMLKPP